MLRCKNFTRYLVVQKNIEEMAISLLEKVWVNNLRLPSFPLLRRGKGKLVRIPSWETPTKLNFFPWQELQQRFSHTLSHNVRKVHTRLLLSSHFFQDPVFLIT